MRVLLVDNFDSFTHNLAQALGGLGADVLVRRNHESLATLLALRPDRVVLSPGPGTPNRTGTCGALVAGLAHDVPVLGVCLGMQLLACLEGAAVARAREPVHGRASPVSHDGRGVFTGLPQGLLVGRYHSLCVVEATLPPTLEATAHAPDGTLMGLRHVARPMEGVQFHPESVLTPEGGSMLSNFLLGRGMLSRREPRPR